MLLAALSAAHAVAHADFKAGEQAYLAENYAVALKELRPLADKGNASAQFYLGAMYELGLGVTEDNDKAIALYRKSADGGVVPALSALARSYYRTGDQPSVDKAFELYLEAAGKGDGSALEFLGRAVAFGGAPSRGLPQSNYLGYKYLWMAVLRGDEDARDVLDDIKGLTDAQKAQAKKEAEKWADAEPLPPLPKA